jgi:hypothetical protein
MELIGLPPMKVSWQWYLCLEFKQQDAWIGAYWRRDGNCIDVWVCLLPMLPLHFSYWRFKERFSCEGCGDTVDEVVEDAGMNVLCKRCASLLD